MSKAVEVKNLYVSYNSHEVLQDVNLSMDKARLIGIVGPNGAGKSTLIKAILGLIPINQGDIEIYGRPLNEMRKKIAYVPQRSNIDWDFPITVKNTVLLGTYANLGLFNRPKAKEKNLAMECLIKVGMKEYADSQIGNLSGGQQQRVFIARALAQEAECFFLDEPFVGVDVFSEGIIINILRELRNEGKTVFVIHHDLLKVSDYFDDLIIINKRIFGAGPVDLVFKTKLMEAAYQSPLSILKNAGVKKW